MSWLQLSGTCTVYTDMVPVHFIQTWCLYSSYRHGACTVYTDIVPVQFIKAWCLYSLYRHGCAVRRLYGLYRHVDKAATTTSKARLAMAATVRFLHSAHRCCHPKDSSMHCTGPYMLRLLLPGSCTVRNKMLLVKIQQHVFHQTPHVAAAAARADPSTVEMIQRKRRKVLQRNKSITTSVALFATPVGLFDVQENPHLLMLS